MGEERLSLYTAIGTMAVLETRLQNAGLAFRKEKADLYVISGGQARVKLTVSNREANQTDLVKAVLGARTFIDQRSNGIDYSAVKHQIALTRTLVGTVIRTDGDWDEAWALLDSIVEALDAIVFNGSEFIATSGDVLFSIVTDP